MNTANMSKSQRRKQRLIERGISLAENANKSIVPAPKASARLMTASNPSRVNPTGRSKSARRRARRRTSGASPYRTGALNVGVNSYLNALINPEIAAGAKVPDEIGYPTGTFQLQAKGTLAISAGGDSTAIMCIPFVSSATSAGFSPIAVATGTTVGGLTSWVTQNWTQRSAIMALYSAVRPVSAVLEVSYIGPSTQDSGQITAGCTYVRGPGTSKYQGATFNDESLLPDMEIWPAKNGARVVWKPLDNSNFEFSDYSNAANADDKLSKLPALVVSTTGTPFTGSQYMWEFVANFEGVTNNDSGNLVDTEPSPINFESLRRAFMWAQEAGNNVRPLVGVVGQAIEFGRTAYGLLQGSTPMIGKAKYRQSSPMSAPMHLNPVTESFGSQGKEEEEEFIGDVQQLSINPTAPPLEYVLPHRSVVRAPGSAATQSPMPARKS